MSDAGATEFISAFLTLLVMTFLQGLDIALHITVMLSLCLTSTDKSMIVALVNYIKLLLLNKTFFF